MHLARKIVLTMLLGCMALAASAAAASAANLYVSTTGSDANSCTSAASPCLTVQKAVEDGRTKPGATTIFVAAGLYKGGVQLNSPADTGTAIVGAGPSATVLMNTGSEPVVAGGEVVSFRLENIGLRHETPDDEPAVGVEGGNLGLKNVDVNATGSGEVAVEADDEFSESSLTVSNSRIVQDSEHGGGIESEGAATTISDSTLETTGEKAADVGGGLAPITVSHSTLITRGADSKVLENEFGNATVSSSTIEQTGASSIGVTSEFGSTTIRFSRLIQRMEGEVSAEAEVSPMTLEHDNFEINAAGVAAGGGGSNITLTSDNVAVNAPTDTQPVFEVEGAKITMRQVNVHGDWIGSVIQGVVAHTASILESNLNDAADTGPPAIELTALSPEGLSLLVQRSRIFAGASADAVVEVEGVGSVVVDSSLLQGGDDGLALFGEGAKNQKAVVAASTIDAGTPGVSGEAGVTSIASLLPTTSGALNVDVEGSVLFEPMTAMMDAGSTLNVNCQNSDAPSQSQAAVAPDGSIDCRSGVHGNDNLPSLGSIFASPFTKYELKKHTKAVNSVPSDTVTLPFGMKPSPFDLGAHKRALYEREGRKCELVQDRGALQIPGQKADCKPKKKHRR